MKVLITMLFERAFNEESKEKEKINEINIYKHSPNKVYIVTIDDKKTIEEANSIQNNFPNLEFEMIFVKEFDVVGITEKLNKIIKKEKGNQIFINVTEGRKTMFLAGVYAASLNKDEVEGAFYLRQDIHELMPVPLIDFYVSPNKLKILVELDKGNKKAMAIANKRHDLIAITLNDPRETELPACGLLTLKDAETGKVVVVDTGNESIRTRYRQSSLERIIRRNRIFSSIGIDHIDVATNFPYPDALVKFFLKRQKRK